MTNFVENCGNCRFWWKNKVGKRVCRKTHVYVFHDEDEWCGEYKFIVEETVSGRSSIRSTGKSKCRFPCFDNENEVVECLLDKSNFKTGRECSHLVSGGIWGSCKKGGRSPLLNEYLKV